MEKKESNPLNYFKQKNDFQYFYVAIVYPQRTCMNSFDKCSIIPSSGHLEDKLKTWFGELKGMYHISMRNTCSRLKRGYVIRARLVFIFVNCIYLNLL